MGIGSVDLQLTTAVNAAFGALLGMLNGDCMRSPFDWGCGLILMGAEWMHPD